MTNPRKPRPEALDRATVEAMIAEAVKAAAPKAQLLIKTFPTMKAR